MSDETRSVPDLADDYVLGLLDDNELQAVESALLTDQAMQSAVSDSRERFLELDMTAKPASVPPEMWENISARLDKSADGTHVLPVAANSNNGSFWRRLALTASAASILLAAGLLWSLNNQPDPVVIAILLDDKGQAQALVEDFGDRSAKVTLLADFAVPEDKVMQVWTLPSKEMGPVSLGLLSTSSTAVLEGPNLPRPRLDQLYEITVEQSGGSPTGRPTGPILVKGYSKAAR
ncbi:anti-sigma factor [Phyllobacterium sp. SB3]|uniref:anti-sigma factor n=1 Tax=Phyllobacterium sp. SB3 TaxID=3156073 RepID=UPI0032AEFC1E